MRLLLREDDANGGLRAIAAVRMVDGDTEVRGGVRERDYERRSRKQRTPRVLSQESSASRELFFITYTSGDLLAT